MIPLFKQFIRDLFYSPEKVTLWLRGGWFTFWQTIMNLSAQGVLPVNPKWTPWITVLAGVLSGGALLAKAGDKNPNA